MKDNFEPMQVGILPNAKGECHNSMGTRIYSIEHKGKTQMALGGVKAQRQACTQYQ